MKELYINLSEYKLKKINHKYFIVQLVRASVNMDVTTRGKQEQNRVWASLAILEKGVIGGIPHWNS